MATQTENLHMTKPEPDDLRDIGILNGNFDIIDYEVFRRALKNEAIKSIERNGTTYTVTRCDGTTFTFDQQDTTYSDASTSAHGLMSAADKSKLDGVAASANNYSLPLASGSARGGVKTGYTQNGKNYPVQLADEKMYVNVPWTETPYSDASTTTHGLMSAADKAKLNGISDGANNYSLPTASSYTKGGVKVGYVQNGRNIPVQLDSDGKMYVTVPGDGSIIQNFIEYVDIHLSLSDPTTYNFDITRSGCVPYELVEYTLDYSVQPTSVGFNSDRTKIVMRMPAADVAPRNDVLFMFTIRYYAT